MLGIPQVTKLCDLCDLRVSGLVATRGVDLMVAGKCGTTESTEDAEKKETWDVKKTRRSDTFRN